MNGTVTIPDFNVNQRFGVLDAKNQIDITRTEQLRAQFNLAVDKKVPFGLVVSPRTKKISRPLQQDIKSTGGKIFEYNPQTNKFTEVKFNPRYPNRIDRE